MGRDAYVLGVGMPKFDKYPEREVKTLTRDALDPALEDAGIEREDLEAAWYSNSLWGLYDFQHCIRGQVALSEHGVDGIPITNVENACAGASTALYEAAGSVEAGRHECVLAIGVEKLYDEDRSKVMQSFLSAGDVDELGEFIEQLRGGSSGEQQDGPADEAADSGEDADGDDGDRSAFMDLYALGARAHMEDHGTTQRQLAAIAAKNHNNASKNPLAQYTFSMTVDEVMEDREVAFPLTRAMCAPIGDGSAAAVVCSEDYLRARDAEERGVRIRGAALRSATRGGEAQVTRRTARAAYEMAGLGPSDVDVAEVHDATAFGELDQSEKLGFFEPGQGGPAAEHGETALDGTIPINPSGGLTARGHPIGASGLAQVHELVLQLRGEAADRQVDAPRIALAQNGGGTLGGGEAAMAVHLLEEP